jgi:hypothetical protein
VTFFVVKKKNISRRGAEAQRKDEIKDWFNFYAGAACRMLPGRGGCPRIHIFFIPLLEEGLGEVGLYHAFMQKNLEVKNQK